MSDLKAAGYKLYGQSTATRNQVWYTLHAVGPQGGRVTLCRTVSFAQYCRKVEEWMNAK
jgi:hypothetical protein